MPINFHDNNNQKTYTTRTADAGWINAVTKLIDIEKIDHAADIGCGGGIYSKALAGMGIPNITGLDFSQAMIDGAESNCRYYTQINFRIGNAIQTGLPDHTFDFILERALIHHLTDLQSCFAEANRIMKEEGTIIIQDRTPADCLLKGTNHHIRGYIFSLFPRLAELEMARRHNSNQVFNALKVSGFKDIQSFKIWETRKKYASKEKLFTDIHSRSGRSILHELNDNELEQLIRHIDKQLGTDNIIEQDRWTIWKATKK
ncbi:Methyltransferase domain-containing protein [Lentibacillus halodurans]|uniref:Methyltransferase domain-containing protein n=1 Tax=Lentibacillus halodurans TaxID=237679 RepID=A0A1I0ZS18_9BACI|nr:class I SAM-dependent methyltransferase [Lentibacillus halodurans]SFB28609.1 Methyltransferase domain-containing protein [Lentibacillus halodurans]